MAKNLRNFYFARLNVFTAAKVDKAEYVMDSIRKKGVREQDNYEYFWEFLDVGIVKIGGTEYGFGNLTKYKEIDEEIVANSYSGVTDTTSVPNRVRAQSAFYIEPHTGLIAFRPVASISTGLFAKWFASLIERANDNLFVTADVWLVQEENKILEEINRFDVIHTLEITLHPSNPRWRKAWKGTDKKLNDMGAESYQQTFRSKKGLTVVEGDPAYSDILMAGDGYGVATIRGEKDGKSRTASTKEVPIIVPVANELEKFETIAILRQEGFKAIGERIDENTEGDVNEIKNDS